MKSISEGQLAAYIESYLARNQTIKRLTNRHFQGTITTVTASGITFLVTVSRTDGADSNTYVCAIQGYTPVVGDLVELEWRDENVAYVKFHLA